MAQVEDRREGICRMKACWETSWEKCLCGHCQLHCIEQCGGLCHAHAQVERERSAYDMLRTAHSATYPTQAERTRITDLSLALSRVDRMLEENEPKHRGAWQRQHSDFHRDHAMAHMKSLHHYVSLEVFEEDLTSAATRALFALEVYLRSRR